MSNTYADQLDVLAALEQARADLTTAKTTIGSLQTQVSTLTSERDSARTDLATVTKERDALKSENASLKEQMSDFNKRLAAEISKHGIRNAETTPKPEAAGKPQTATEKLLAAKGVKSLDELTAKRNK